MSVEPIVNRFRRRIPPPASPVHSAQLSKPPEERTRVFSEGATIRGLRVAFEETPVRLRQLEEGWRDRRRVGLREMSENGVADRVESLGARKAEPAIQRGRRIPSPVGVGTRVKDKPSNESNTKVIGPILAENPRDAPPSPPLTPPLTSSPLSEEVAPSLPATRQHKTQSPASPVLLLASPLPPTTRPVRLTSRSSDTIHIHAPDSPTSITLCLQRQSQLIRISHDGRVITFSSNYQSREGRKVDLGKWEKWAESDGRDWELVRRLVEGYKKHTPKVRLYLPSGHLTITCSTPPDIILNFTHTVRPRIDGTKRSSSSPHNVKVQVRCSRLEKEVTIDTASSSVGSGERLRTKRSATLKPRPSSEPDGDLHGLQALLRDASGWGEAEREGLKRLWDLQEEWERYG